MFSVFFETVHIQTIDKDGWCLQRITFNIHKVMLHVIRCLKALLMS